jgi:[ribosomal protein S18]-alanine N-acetyltransferase
MIEVSLQVRPAVQQDQHQIANLMFFESHVHRHLDWHAPLEWLGSPYYWVVEDNGRVVAALACPQSPQGMAWVRLFTHARQLPLDDAWTVLWKIVQRDIGQQGGATVALIAMQGWLIDLLVRNHFVHDLDIIMLEWKGSAAAPKPPLDGINVRAMQSDDLPAVAEMDALAFAPLWQNPLEALEKALPQATSATVAEDNRGLVGYQISTANPFGAHLARLAVRPDAQQRGIGSLIVTDLIQRLSKKGVARVTVNTQSNNPSSLALYKKMGFTQTGEKFPVYTFSIPPSP